uniref:Uncharacterized protein n=1 Tax=Panagrolaimus davidi TaxID=227884 RepID=A0A914Q7D4_9BILA
MSYNNRDDYDERRMNPRVPRQEERYEAVFEGDAGRRGGDGGRVGYDDGYYDVQETPRQHQQPYRNNPVENERRREATRGRSVGGGQFGAQHQEPRDYHVDERRRRTSETSIPRNRNDFQIGRRPLGRNEELPSDPVQNYCERGEERSNRTTRGHEHRHSAERRSPPPVVSDYDYPPTITPREGIPPMNDRNRDRLQSPNQRGGGHQDHYNNDRNQDYYVSPPSNNPQRNRERFPSPSPQRDGPNRIAPQREPVFDNSRTRRNEQLVDEPYYDNLPLQNEQILNLRVNRDLSDYPEEDQPLRYQHQRRRESPDREFADQRNYGREVHRHPRLQRDFVDRPSQQQHERDLSHLDPRLDLEPPVHHDQQNYGRDYRRTDIYYPQRNHPEDDIRRHSPQRYRGVDQQQAEQQIRGGRQQAEMIYEEPAHHFRREEHERYQHQLRQPSPQQHPGRLYDHHIYDEPPLQNREQPRQLPYVPPVYEEPPRHPLPHEDEAERQRPHQPLAQPGRDRPQADTIYATEQPEQDNDYPPFDVHRRPKQQNAINNHTPLRHDYLLLRQLHYLLLFPNM